MATTAAPYGMRPVGLLSSRPMPHGMRLLKIASAYATQISAYDAVKCVNDGTIAKDIGTATMTPIGIFIGVSYTDATTGYTNRGFWTASTVASDAYGHVVDDPDLLFQVQLNTTGAQTVLFNNAAQVVTAGDTVYGLSKNAIGSVNTTSTLPVRIVDFVEGPFSTAGDAYTDLICTWNAGMHAYRNATGV